EAEAENARSKERLHLQAEQNDQLCKTIQLLEANRATAHDELAHLHEQVAPLADNAPLVDELRAELDAARAEAGRLADQLAQSPDGEMLQEQLAGVDVERRQLENELDLLRHRGAELVEQLAEQKRIAAAERDAWSEELRQLRKAVEMQSDALAQRGARPSAAAPSVAETIVQPLVESSRPHATNGVKPEDKVLDSVMEQFATIQKSKVRKLAKSKR
ncbi:MAG: hypothetical protein WDZ48_05910, partial [Pirellulales bacterium]